MNHYFFLGDPVRRSSKFKNLDKGITGEIVEFRGPDVIVEDWNNYDDYRHSWYLTTIEDASFEP